MNIELGGLYNKTTVRPISDYGDEELVDLAMQCREIIECDTSRISQLGGTMFLIIGFNKNTRADPGQAYKNGEPFDYDYVDEKVVASGETEEDLVLSAQEYKRLCGLTMEEYLSELAPGL